MLGHRIQRVSMPTVDDVTYMFICLHKDINTRTVSLFPNHTLVYLLLFLDASRLKCPLSGSSKQIFLVVIEMSWHNH